MVRTSGTSRKVYTIGKLIYLLIFKRKKLFKNTRFYLKSERRLFTKFHRQLFCWIDQWHGLTMEDIRRIEDQVQAELNKDIKEGQVKGMMSGEE